MVCLSTFVARVTALSIPFSKLGLSDHGQPSLIRTEFRCCFFEFLALHGYRTERLGDDPSRTMGRSLRLTMCGFPFY
jgi:hypothetical protein